MTPAPLLDHPRTTPPLTGRFTRWGSWLFFLLLAGNVIVCHGCHGDEDNELCAPPPAKSRLRLGAAERQAASGSVSTASSAGHFPRQRIGEQQ